MRELCLAATTKLPVVYRPTFASHAVTAVHQETPGHGTTSGCGTPFDTTHGANRPWCGRSGCVYNTSNRWTRVCDHLAALCAPGPGDDPASDEQAWRVPESRGKVAASKPESC